jgi:hypothetical protein
MATTTLPKSSGKDTRVGAVGDLKAYESVPRKSSDDSDDSKYESTMASDAQKVETLLESRNPGKMKVDPNFEDLSRTAQDFLQTQGITSALDLMATNVTKLAPAWKEWN